MSVADRVIAVCEKQSGKEAHRDSKLVENLGLDSLDRVELAMVLEDTFNVRITDEEVDNPDLDHVGALIELVEQKLAIAKIGKNSAYGKLGVDLNRPGAEL